MPGGAVRVDPEAQEIRARNNSSQTSAPREKKQERKKKDKDEDRKETICTMVVKELDPRSIIMWPALFVRSLIRVLQVLATIRHITLGDVIAGLVNTALLFTFAAVFSSAIFGDVGLSQYVALGTGVNLITTIILQFSFTVFSDVGVNIAGPDVNPAIFIATMASIARQAMVQNMEDAAAANNDNPDATYSPTTSPVGHHRVLSTTNNDDNQLPPGIVIDPERLLATVLAIVMISSCMFGTFVYILGRLKVSRGVQLVPGAVLSGFMACIGYLVILKALKTAMSHDVWEQGPLTWPFWMFVLPSIPIGVSMYMQKRLHLGSPVIILPIILTTPLIVFFAAVYGSGSNIEIARAQGWLFPAFTSEAFYTQFIQSYGKSDKVEWSAISATMPTMIVMLFIVTIDALLKQASIRKLLKAHDLRIDHELMLMGKANILTGMLVGVCGYPQPKLVAINYGVVQNTTSRVSGIIIVTLHAILFFLGFPLINYLPRFWLAGVLIFAAAGFIVENLWDARLKFSRKEYLSIWAIVIVNALFGLAWAVLVGVVLSALIFAMAYSRGGAIRAVISGGEYRSSVVRSTQDDLKLEHIGTKAVIIQLHRYVFFGSAAYVNEVMIGLIKEQDTIASEEKRAGYFVFDWANVEDIDVTAMDVVTEMLSKMLSSDAPSGGHGAGHGGAHETGHSNQPKRLVLFTGLEPRLRKKLAGEKIIQSLHEPEYRAAAGQSSSAIEDDEKGIVGGHRRCFDTLDRGMEFVEERLLQWSWEIRKRWFKFDSFRDFHLRAKILMARQSFEQVLAAQLGEHIWKFVEPIQVPKGWTLCRAGDVDNHLYLLRDGSLTAYVEQEDGDSSGEAPKTSRLQTLGHGAFVNEDAVYVDRPIVPYTVVADVDSVVLALSRENMAKLDYMYPAVAIEVHRKVLRHAARTKHKIVRMLGSLHLWDAETAQPEDREKQIITATLTADANGGSASAAEESLISNMQAEPIMPSSIAVDGTTAADAQAQGGLLSSTFGAIQGVTSTTIGAIQGVTSTTFGAIQGVTSELAHTTVAALQNGLIVSGFREGDEATDDMDLLDTTQLRDGAGELSGRRFAQQFTGKRRQRGFQEEGPASPRSPRDGNRGQVVVTREVMRAVTTVRDFRAVKLIGAAEDGDDAVHAAFNLLHASGRFVDVSTVALPALSLRLSYVQIVNAKSAFAKSAGVPLPRAPRGNATGGALSGPTAELPRSQVRDALALVGLTIPSADTEFMDLSDPIPITEDEFLRLVARLSFAQLPEEFFQRAVEFFVSITREIDGFLTERALTDAIATSGAKVSPGSVGRFIQKWSTDDKGVDLSAFCSALAQHAKTIQEDEQVEADWKQLSGGRAAVSADDISRVFGCTLLEAQEMVYEADCDHNGSLSFFDLLDTLSTFREGSNSWLSGRLATRSM